MTQDANNRPTFMTDLQTCMKHLEDQGYTDQYKLDDGRLRCLATNRYFHPHDMKAVNFYRFEGISNPSDMSILFAVETRDGRKGTLVDAYGLYADGDMGKFLQEVETHKHVHDVQVY